MMQHPPPPDGIKIDAEEHAMRLAEYKARIKRALERWKESKDQKEQTQ